MDRTPIVIRDVSTMSSEDLLRNIELCNEAERLENAIVGELEQIGMFMCDLDELGIDIDEMCNADRRLYYSAIEATSPLVEFGERCQAEKQRRDDAGNSSVTIA